MKSNKESIMNGYQRTQAVLKGESSDKILISMEPGDIVKIKNK